MEDSKELANDIVRDYTLSAMRDCLSTESSDRLTDVLAAALEVHKANMKLKAFGVSHDPQIDGALTELDTAMVALKESVS